MTTLEERIAMIESWQEAHKGLHEDESFDREQRDKLHKSGVRELNRQIEDAKYEDWRRQDEIRDLRSQLEMAKRGF